MSRDCHPANHEAKLACFGGQIVYTMQVEFDSVKEATNVAKHRISLARAADMEIFHYVEDGRYEYGEVRYRAWGAIDGKAYCWSSPIAAHVYGQSAYAVPEKRKWIAMPRKTELEDDDIIIDEDNPEWTEEDFKRARPPHEVLPPHILAAFPKTRGPQVAPKKVPVSIRLSPEVVEHFKKTGPGWQTRIDEVLKKVVGL